LVLAKHASQALHHPNFDDAFTDNIRFGCGELFEDGEHQLLCAVRGAGSMGNALVVQRTRLLPSQKAFRAAQYVRMSTDLQRYSIENQVAVIGAYAELHNLSIVRDYRDEGESGLRIKNRRGLQLLLGDVTSGQADFKYILVYDVSRWGRFQDIDESAHYEFICKQAGIKIAYCAEQFDNDGSLISSMLKTLKRVMAAEYSRELSSKIFTAHCRNARLGFRQGGPITFGLLRELVDQDRSSRGYLGAGQRKALQTDRVLVRHGPTEELDVVRSIFRRFVLKRHTSTRIARDLNREEVTNRGRQWSPHVIDYILQNENYIGNFVYNRRTCRLRTDPKRNPPEQWVRAKNGLEPIVPPLLFATAQKFMERRKRGISDDEMLNGLKKLLAKKGELTRALVDRTPSLPCSSSYQNRFGSLRNAFNLIGYSTKRDYRYYDCRSSTEALFGKLASDLIARIEERDGAAFFESSEDLLTVDGQLLILFRIARIWRPKIGAPRWTIIRRRGRPRVATFAVRLNEDNESVLDYFLFQSQEIQGPLVRFSERTLPRKVGANRMETIEAVVDRILAWVAGHSSRQTNS
jgi:DNA invertase Pin-like site-specific DNA recombinase